MAVIVSENFDASGSLPSGWAGDTAQYAISSVQSVSPSNSLRCTSTNAAHLLRYDTADTASGNTRVASWIWTPASVASLRLGLILLRASAALWSTVTAYGARITFDGGSHSGFQIERRASNSSTVLVSGGASTCSAEQWYRMILEAETVGSQVDLVLKVQRASDNYWLVSGTWQATEGVTLSHSDTSGSRITAAGRSAVVTFVNVSSTMPFFDDFLFETLDSPPSESVGLIGRGLVGNHPLISIGRGGLIS